MKFGTESSFWNCGNDNPAGTNSSNTTTQETLTLNSNIITNHISEEYRNQDSITTTIQMQRTNESSNVKATSNTVNITIQFTPKYAPFKMEYWDYDNNGTNNHGNSITPRFNIIYRRTSRDIS